MLWIWKSFFWFILWNSWGVKIMYFFRRIGCMIVGFRDDFYGTKLWGGIFRILESHSEQLLWTFHRHASTVIAVNYFPFLSFHSISFHTWFRFLSRICWTNILALIITLWIIHLIKLCRALETLCCVWNKLICVWLFERQWAVLIYGKISLISVEDYDGLLCNILWNHDGN